MIHFEHINLVIKDLEKSLAFYKAAFPHWHIRNEGAALGTANHGAGYTLATTINTLH
jgi:catechol 2,3-dioxygenase-like lactoylglutathione lyase family enzyme